MKIGIIGAGASGIVTAIISKTENNSVILFEKNDGVCKKVLITGNGKCNYWNEEQLLDKYVGSSKEKISQIIDFDSSKQVLELFDSLGIVPKIKNGYYYPSTGSAKTIKNVLLDEAILRDVIIKTNTNIKEVETLESGFIVKSDNEEIYVDILVISTGSKSFPKTGSDGSGYEFLNKLGHTINTPLPALCALKSRNPIKSWSGVRSFVSVSLYEDGNFIKSDEGEIQLTDYGISGICVFNLSLYASLGLSHGKREQVKINFVPFINEKVDSWLINKTKITNKKIHDLIKCILNEKVALVILEKSKVRNVLYNELVQEEKTTLIKNLTSFNIDIRDTNDYENAQVCIGGLSLEEINTNTMESKLIKNLFVTGEVLDITGYCGGYNLGIAWRTGIKAGMYIRSLK